MDGHSNRLIVALAAGLLVVAAAGCWLIFSDEVDENGLHDRAGQPQNRSAAGSAGEKAASPAREFQPEENSGTQPVEKERVEPDPPPEHEDAESGGTLFAGQVVDTSTGQPVTSYSLMLRQLRKSDGTLLKPYPPWRSESIDSPQGRFSLSLEEGGTYIVRHEAPGYQRADTHEIEIRDNAAITGYILELSPGLTMTGRVVADATGTPLAGAEVLPFFIRSFQEQAGETQAETRSDGLSSRTGPDGRFTVTGLRPGPHRLWARHPDFAEGYGDGETEGGDVEIRLRPGFRFFGLVRDKESRPAPGVEVNLFSQSIAGLRDVITGADGRYTSPPLPPGSYILSVARSAASSGPAGKVLSEMLSIDLLDSDVEVDFGPRPGQVVWQGTLFSGEGIPVAGAELSLRRQFDSSSTGKSGKATTSSCRAKTDDHGFFEIGPVEPGTYDVSVQLSTNTLMTAYYPVDRLVFDQPGLIVRDIHLRRTELSGVVIDENDRKPIRHSNGFVMACSSKGKIFTTSVDAEGRFSFISIPPGTYNLFADGPEISQGSLKNVVLDENSVLKNLEIVIPVNGTLDLEVSGLDELRSQTIEIEIRSLDDDRSWTLSNSSGGCVVDHAGVCAFTLTFRAGSFRVVLRHETIGQAGHSFVISAGETTRVEIDRSAFVPR